MRADRFPASSAVLNTAVKWVRRQSITVLFSIIGLLIFSLDLVKQYTLQTPEPSSPGIIGTLAQSVVWYHSFTSGGYRKSRAHFVRFVRIAQGEEPDDVLTPGSYCSQRLFLSQLLIVLENQGAGAVLIDKYFGDKCPADRPESKALSTAIQRVSRKLPIVIGVHANTAEELASSQDGELTPEQKARFERAQLILAPHVELAEGANVAYGLLTLDEGTDRVPLSWDVFDGTGNEFRSMRTVSLLVAQAYDSSSDAEDRFRGLEHRGATEHPYTNLMGAKEIPAISAVQLLCNGQYTPGSDWKQCAGGPYAEQLIRGHVAIIGEFTESDVHDSPLGETYGPILQANYVESILDDRCFWPVSPWVEFFMGLAWFGVVLFILERSNSLLWSFLYSVGISAVLWIILFDVVLQQWGVYLTIGAPGLMIFVGKLGDRVWDRIKKESPRESRDPDARE